MPPGLVSRFFAKFWGSFHFIENQSPELPPAKLGPKLDPRPGHSVRCNPITMNRPTHSPGRQRHQCTQGTVHTAPGRSRSGRWVRCTRSVESSTGQRSSVGILSAIGYLPEDNARTNGEASRSLRTPPPGAAIPQRSSMSMHEPGTHSGTSVDASLDPS